MEFSYNSVICVVIELTSLKIIRRHSQCRRRAEQRMVFHYPTGGSRGAVYLSSEVLPCMHAFSTRIGGVIESVHTASLNLAFGRGDDKATVLRNLAIFGEAVGFEPESVISLPQLHSTKILTVTAADRGRGFLREADDGCDGYVTADAGITLGVKTADCVPVLLCAVEGNGQPYAVAALHAGWRGTVAYGSSGGEGIAGLGVEALVRLGAKREDIRAAIGPCIGVCCFEVGEDVRDAVRDCIGSERCERFVIPTGKGTDGVSRFRADLKGINRLILMSHGVAPENIDVSGHCTCCRPELFYSHRRDGNARGTMLAVISLKEA